MQEVAGTRVSVCFCYNIIMNRKRFFFYVLLCVVLCLVMGVAFLARPSHQSRSSSALPSTASSKAVVTPGVSSGPALSETEDFTALLNPAEAAVTPSGKTPARVSVPSGGRGAVSYNVAPSLPATPAGYVPSAADVVSLPSGASYSASQPSRRVRPFVSSYRAPSVSSVSSSSYGAQGEESSFSQEASRERDRILAPFTPQMTRREQTALNQKLQNFSVGLERAIASAILPKSKREQNIEKYLARSRGEAAVMDNGAQAVAARQAGGGAAQVMQRLAAQSKSIVNNVRQNYGDSAASEAQSIMNDFQAEMAETLNAPTAPEEKNIQAQAVNNKYNQKLQKLNNNAAFVKMAEQLRTQNEEYLNKVGQTYGPQTEAALRPIMEEFTNKRMQIWATPQSEEDALAQNLALDEQIRKEQERIVKETAPDASAANLTALQNELVKERILEESRKVEAGEASSPVFRESTEARAQNEAAWKKEGENIIKSFESLGPESKSDAQKEIDNLMVYRRQIRQKAQEEGWSVAEVTRLDMEATEKANETLQQIRSQGMEKMFNRQYEKQFEQAPEDYKKHVRPIWEKYNKERAALAGEVTDQKTYQSRMQEISQREMQEIQAAENAYMASAGQRQ